MICELLRLLSRGKKTLRKPRALAQIVLFFLTKVQNFEVFLIHALKGVASQKQILRKMIK